MRLISCLALIILLLGVVPTVLAEDQQGSIRWLAAQAAQRGSQAVTIQAPLGITAKLTTLQKAFALYDAVVVVPIAAVTEATDDYHIYTWYKLKVLERLSSHPHPELDVETIPDGLKPLHKDEVVTRIVGGTVLVDGVFVKMVSPSSPLLAMGKRHLLFLVPDGSGSFEQLRTGADTIFTIDNDDKLEPLVDNSSPFQQDVAASTDHKMHYLRNQAEISPR